ncbi:MAG: deoxyguanosinetriphosphate triphosphohydrolase [Firmicutes bacterium]|nr:deoxyguanosinetriphosphate triphosphohydrolase [Bacillota bacterium]MBR0105212.1 deoxyguanosinetriphosphate triphosphohydrolase [Bacillota bacterium]
MNLRERQEELELSVLSPFATKSRDSKGRSVNEPQCDIRTDFQRDRDRIIHSGAFRRLKHKTQVFISPEDDYFRTRLTHTLEVSQIARTISRALRLNEDLTEAIALGHDLGHTPFGHAGERVLNTICPFGFEHNLQSIRVVEKIEKHGSGLNLTFEVLDGIKNHRTSAVPATPEGAVVRLSDKIAYINHDIDDSIKSGILRPDSIPEDITARIGSSTSSRINSMVHDVIASSDGLKITASPDMTDIISRLKAFMFKKVYFGEKVLNEMKKTDLVIESLYEYYMENPKEMGETFIILLNKGEPLERVVCDYIAFMTDDFAIKKFTDIFCLRRYF